MPFKPAEVYPAGGVDSRSNPISMPKDRYLAVHDLWPQQDGSFRLRDGYSLLASGLQVGVPIHSIISVIGPGPTRTPLIVFWQNLSPYVYDTVSGIVSSSFVRGAAIQSSARFSYFYTAGHLHGFNGTDAKWFDGFIWRDIGLSLPIASVIAQLSVVESVRELSAAEAAAVTLTLAGGGTFLADATGRTFFCAFYDLDKQEIGPATIPIGPNNGLVKFALNQELQIGVLPSTASTHPRWVKLPALTGDGNGIAEFAAISTKQITGGGVVVQAYALTEASASNNPTQFPAPSFAVGLSASNLNAGPVTATVSGSEQSIPDANMPVSMTVRVTGVDEDGDFGTLTLTIDGTNDFHRSFIVRYEEGDTTLSLATAFAAQINQTQELTAVSDTTSFTVTPRLVDQVVYSAIATSKTLKLHTIAPDFSIIPAVTQFGQRTIYDTGTVSVSVNGVPAMIPYGPNDTPSSLALFLAQAINLIGVSATASGAVITISAPVTGLHIQFRCAANGFSVDDVVGMSNTGDLAYDGRLFTVLPSAPPSYVFNITALARLANVVTATLGASAFGLAQDGIVVGSSIVVATGNPAWDGTFVITQISGLPLPLRGCLVRWAQTGSDATGPTGTITYTAGSAADVFTIFAPNASAPVQHGTAQKLLAAGASGTSLTITAPLFFTPYQVNLTRGLAASTVGGDQPGYQFYGSLYTKNAGGHVGNRVTIGTRLVNAVRCNLRVVGTLLFADSEQQLLIGRTSDGAELPYAVMDTAGNWVSLDGTVVDPLVDGSNIDGNAELPSRNWPPPGTLDANAQLAALAGGAAANPPIFGTLARAWVESDHCCGALQGSPTIYRSGSAQDMREGQFVGLPEQSWDPGDLETFPTAQPIVSGQGYQQESYVFSDADAAMLFELSGETQWQGPFSEGAAGQHAWAVGWRGMPYWITKNKQLSTISQGGYAQMAGMYQTLSGGPVPISDEYELALLGQIGDQYLGEVEVVYVRIPVKRVDHLRICARDANGNPLTFIHDFNMRDDRSPYGQAYQEKLTGALALPATFAAVRDRNLRPITVAGGSDGNLYVLYQQNTGDGSSDFITGEALMLVYLGPERNAVKFLEWYGDPKVKWFATKNLNISIGSAIPFDTSQIQELTDDPADPAMQRQGDEGNSHYVVTVPIPEMFHALILMQLSGISPPVVTSPCHIPLDPAGRVWLVAPQLGTPRP